MRYTVVMGGFVLICAGFLVAAAQLMLSVPEPPKMSEEWHTVKADEYYSEKSTPYAVIHSKN